MADIASKLTHTTTIQWSDGSNFNGFALVIAAKPVLGAGSYPQLALSNEVRRIRVPEHTIVPIVDGSYSEQAKILRTDKIVPPGVKYCSWFYDTLGIQIAAGPTLFTATADETALVPPTLTAPTSGSCPSPEASTLGSVTITTTIVPTREDIAGTKNGVNTAFTISKSGTVVNVYWNGLLLEEGVGYTISGTNITAISPYLPDTGDSYEAVIW